MKDDVEIAAFLAAEKARNEARREFEAEKATYEAEKATYEAEKAALLARIKELEAAQKN